MRCVVCGKEKRSLIAKWLILSNNKKLCQDCAKNLGINEFYAKVHSSEEILSLKKNSQQNSNTKKSSSESEVNTRVERWPDYKWEMTLHPSNTYKKYNHVQDIDNLNTLLLKYNLKVDDYVDSPTLTTYLVNLNIDSKINSILKLEKNFQIACNDNNVRVYMEGNRLCIEKKGADNTVGMRNLVPNGFIGQKRMLMCIGIDNGGKKLCYDLNKAPHILVAGTTGSGKSVLLHQIICTLLMNHSRDTEFIGIDPKGTELSKYRTLPCFNYISTTGEAIKTVEELCYTMDERYNLFQLSGDRDIESYISKGKFMKRIVCIIDEFADMILTAGKDVESYVVRLAQKARAAGIHLIIATQRPTANVITGLIKANIPTRIALKVVNGLESRLILDRNGAEKLNGRGDMLFLPNGEYEPIRCQSAYITDNEINNICVKAYAESGGDASALRDINGNPIRLMW